MKRRNTRRNFLRAAGLSIAAAPFLSSLVRRATADTGGAPLRFVFMFTGNQQVEEHWLPRGGERDFTLGPALESLAPVQSKLLFLQGLLGGGAGGHSAGMSETTTGRPSPVASGEGMGVPTGGPSIDQFLASRMEPTPIRSLQLGLSPGNSANDHIVYSASGLPILATGSATGAFDRMFSLANEDPAAADARRLQRRSVLDSVRGELSALSTRLGPSGRRLLDEHLTLVREREEALANPVMPSQCTFPDRPAGADPIAEQFANITTAFRCDLTRVATMQIGGYGGDASYRDYGIENAGHHNAAHGGGTDPVGRLLELQSIHASRLSDFLQALDAVEEGEGTLLDHTVVVWASELGLSPAGNDGHSRRNLPLLIAGGACAGLDLGRSLNLGGIPYQHLLYSLTQLFGHEDIEQFGDEGTELISSLFA